jgi:hypothetical protein
MRFRSLLQGDGAMQKWARLIASLLFLAATVGVSSGAGADTVLFANPYGDTTAGGDQGLDFCTGCLGNFRIWDTFSLGADSNISEIDAELGLWNTSSIEFSIWTADRTQELFAQSIPVGSLDKTPVVTVVYDIAAHITGLNDLAAGTYALSIYNGNPNETLSWVIASSIFDGSGFQSFYADGTGITDPATGLPWKATGFDYSFRIVGSPVPLPAALPLFASGLAGLGWLSRRKRKAAAEA